jgi:hypothetical protein
MIGGTVPNSYIARLSVLVHFPLFESGVRWFDSSPGNLDR